MKKTVAAAILMVVLITACDSGVSTARMEAGKKVYDANCLGCHMANGKGVPRLNPPLVKSPYVMGHPGSLIELVLKGSEFFGNADRNYNNLMAPFSALTDQQIADVTTYIRNTYGETGDEINAEDVKQVREKIK